jgi:ATP-dependent DNA helicase PIF1
MTQQEALAILKTGVNVFLTGEPGSGKTHTVNQYISYLRSRGVEPAITASTGIAATHIGGYTVHSWSGIGIKRDLSPYELDAIASNKRVYSRVRLAQVLIIDEVSMLSDRTLAMVDAVCREVRRDAQPFGGLQVILVGDFFQLPPVNKRAEREDEGSAVLFDTTARFACDSSAWGALNPLVCYLTEQHRQEDDAYLEFLCAVREAKVGEQHRTLLRTRYARTAQKGTTELYSHNADVDVLNSTQLGLLAGTARTFEMSSWGGEKLVESLKRGCLSPEVLSLKVGARVMFTKNDTITQRFANGTLGTVKGFDSYEGNPIVKTNGGATIVAEPMEWNLQDGGKVLARLEQVPLRLAWAMTVHKSQGMSLDAAHMDLSDCFEYGQGYVALSRVRTLAGLSLAGLNDRALEVHPDILKKDREFREQSLEAQDAFSKLPTSELSTLHTNFVRACGGREPKAVEV